MARIIEIVKRGEGRAVFKNQRLPSCSRIMTSSDAELILQHPCFTFRVPISCITSSMGLAPWRKTYRKQVAISFFSYATLLNMRRISIINVM